MPVSNLDFIPSQDPIKQLQQSYGARNASSPRSAGRKMSTPATVYQMLTSLPSNADGQLSANFKGSTLFNIVKNGNFNNTDGWLANVGTTLSASDNKLTVTGSGFNAMLWALFATSVPISNGKKVYIRAKCKVTNTDCTSINLRADCTTSGSALTLQVLSNPVQNQQYILSGVGTYTTQSTYMLIRVDHVYADATTSNGKVMEVQQVMAVDISSLPADIQSLSDAQIKAYLDTQPWFDGTKSVQAQRVKSVGKNLIRNITDFVGESYYFTTGALAESANAFYSPRYIPIRAGSTYMMSNNGLVVADWTEMVFYDRNKIYITGYHQHTNPIFTAPTNACYARVSFFNQGLFGLPQLELSSVATEYQPYSETIVYLPPIGKSLPNGVKDEINISDGKRTQRVSEKVLQASVITYINTGWSTTVDFAYIPISALVGIVPARWNTLGLVSIPNYTDRSNYAWESVSSVIAGDYIYNTDYSSTNIVVAVAKGTTLEQTKTLLAGLTLTYQLATPIITQYMGLGSLDALPNGSLIIEPVIRGVKLPTLGTGKIIVTDANAPISAIESVYRIDTGADGLQTKVDVTSLFAIDSDNLSITCVTADYTKPYEYICAINPEYSTIPVLTYSYPETDALSYGVAPHSYASAAADWVLTTSESQCAILVATLASGVANIIAPDRKGTPYWLQNDSGQTLTVKKSGGTGATVATGKKALFVHTGTDYVKFSEI